MDDYASNKVRYAGKVFEKSLEAEKEGEKIRRSGHAGLQDHRSNDLKNEALQLQLAAQTNANMAQLLDINTRLYKLHLKRSKIDEGMGHFRQVIQRFSKKGGHQP